MKPGYWRSKAAPIIRRVIEVHGRKDTPELRRALRDAYPFGLMKHHPYKVWRAEVRRQLNTRPRQTKAQIEADLFFQPPLPFPETPCFAEDAAS